MTRSEFVIVYLPFDTSDMTLEALVFASNEEEALKVFALLHPQVQIKSVTKK